MSRPVLAGVPLGCPDNLFHWSTKQELGQGSFGIVYKATCAASCSSMGFHGMQAGATYAVKAVLKSEEIMLYLRREVSVLRMLDSEYFVKLLYAFQDSSTVYLVEELFEGKELFDVVVERRGLPERIAVDVARQLLEGLAYLHSLDIVHRDLKLENVLVQEDPESGQLRAKIIDFGLAKFLREPMSLNNPRCPYASSVFDVSSSDESVEELDSSDSGLLPDTPVGTKWYVDVHALQPLRAYATRLATRKDLRKLDIFSVGVITYVMLTGYFPFPSEDPKTHACGILEGVKFPSTLADQTSAQAKEFLRALLRPERTLRPSAQECLQMPWLTVQA